MENIKTKVKKGDGAWGGKSTDILFRNPPINNPDAGADRGFPEQFNPFAILLRIEAALIKKDLSHWNAAKCSAVRVFLPKMCV
jgi:hypothetical protein